MGVPERVVTLSMPVSVAIRLLKYVSDPLEGRRSRLRSADRESITARLHKAVWEIQVRSLL